MFNKIMVPIDVSDGNKWALATALELAQQTRARVTLIHVIQRVAGIQPGELRRFYRRLLTISERKLKRAARRFAAKGVSVRRDIRIGEPVAEIVRAAAKNKIDLMVMGSHSVDVSRPTRGWGTISYRVGLLCQCPILLVKRREIGPEPKRAARRWGRSKNPGSRGFRG